MLSRIFRGVGRGKLRARGFQTESPFDCAGVWMIQPITLCSVKNFNLTEVCFVAGRGDCIDVGSP